MEMSKYKLINPYPSILMRIAQFFNNFFYFQSAFWASSNEINLVSGNTHADWVQIPHHVLQARLDWFAADIYDVIM